MATWDWARKLLTQAASGERIGRHRHWRKTSVDEPRRAQSATGRGGECGKQPRNRSSGKVLDARQGKVWLTCHLVSFLANKVASFQAEPDDTHYPTEKLVKDALDLLDDRIDNIIASIGYKRYRGGGCGFPAQQVLSTPCSKNRP